MAHFGERLSSIRRVHGLSSAELAHKADLAKSHVLYMETDERDPGPETLRRLAVGLEVSIEELLGKT